MISPGSLCPGSFYFSYRLTIKAYRNARNIEAHKSTIAYPAIQAMMSMKHATNFSQRILDSCLRTSCFFWKFNPVFLIFHYHLIPYSKTEIPIWGDNVKMRLLCG